MCTCRGCYLLFTAEQASLRYRAVPDRYLSFPDVRRSTPGRVGRPADPRWARVPVLQLRARPHGRLLPGPGRCHRVRAGSGRMAPRSSMPTPARPPRADVEALLLRAVRSRSRGIQLPRGADRHLLRAGRSAALPVARLRRWQEARDAIDEFFAMVERAQPSGATAAPGGASVNDATTSPSSTSSPSRTPPRRSSPPGCASRSPPARRSTRSRCAARSGSSRSDGGMRRPTSPGCAPCSVIVTAGSTPSGRSCGCRPARWSRGSPVSPRSIWRCRAPTTSRSPARATCTRSARARSRWPFCSRGPCSLRGVNGFGVQQVPWDCEASYQLPVSVWQQMIASYFPDTGWIRLDHDVLASLADFKARARADHLGRDRADPAGPRRRSHAVSALDMSRPVTVATGPRDRRRHPLRGLSALPLPRELVEEPSRWQFGVLGPRALPTRASLRIPTMAMQCLLERPARDALPCGDPPVRALRFLQLQLRQVESWSTTVTSRSPSSSSPGPRS